ncbi:lipocalin-like domain-containing protein [Sinanaerobacter chloroacetimidivorans]|uniref:Lipocalin-like domain-containing protein n=1 Tax=Sinanaerobacter chloroacetimidivorans TaxID=2818044 RepID=A0A8J7W1D8_9FIRM|nr:lipocalin-like domain-containing protein [Sinanaerobacter chloroacetimidivorans]MBR0597793.1 lipocalin-like domain-containing protein [Sinanaerobacter chloroacetimidivorans]
MSKSLREALVGAWKLVEYSIEDKNKQGEKFYPLGKDAAGFLMYTPDGYVSAQMMASGRPSYANGHIHTGTTEEMAKAAKGYMAYSGQYEVDEETNTLTHHMEVSMNPTWLGQAQERFVKLEGNTITISTAGNHAVLVWKRAEDHAK